WSTPTSPGSAASSATRPPNRSTSERSTASATPSARTVRPDAPAAGDAAAGPADLDPRQARRGHRVRGRHHDPDHVRDDRLRPPTCQVAGQPHVAYAVYAARRAPGGGIGGAIRGTASFVFHNFWQLLVAGAISAIIALVLARWLARGMTQPIRDMAKAAESLARGDYSGRVPVTTRDELGKLAEAFNRMAGELEGVERLRRDLVANV